MPPRTDVLVAGAGLAGHVAALTAAEAGASVLLIEKGDTFGGTTAVAGGGFAFAGTDQQRAAGIDDRAIALREDLWAAGRHQSDPALLDMLADEQLATYDWLVRSGVRFSLSRSGVSGKIDRTHSTEQGQSVRALHDRLAGCDRITYRAGCSLRRLLGDASGVSGAVIVEDGDEQEVRVERGIVLATGGFTRSTELVAAYAPRWTSSVRMGGRHNEGDGLVIARRLGAGQADMAFIEPTFGGTLNRFPLLDQAADDDPMLLLSFMKGAIIVNRLGRRFVNEGLNYKQISQACVDQPDGVGFQLLDARIWARSDARFAVYDFATAERRGLVFRADSVAGLADAIGVPSGSLQETVERYNADAATGVDSAFGRRIASYGGDSPRIDAPPFYAIPSGNVLTTTYCGLSVDPAMHVVTEGGLPIPGLFAAGEVVGGFHGAAYYSGSALTKAAISGRVAGRSAAAMEAMAND